MIEIFDTRVLESFWEIDILSLFYATTEQLQSINSFDGVSELIAACQEKAKQITFVTEGTQELAKSYQKAVLSAKVLEDAENDVKQKQKVIFEIQQTIASEQKELSSLTGLFAKKRRAEMEHILQYRENELQKAQDDLKTAEEYYQKRKVQSPPPDPNQYQYDVAKLYYEAGLYREAYESVSDFLTCHSVATAHWQ
ncbi:MAG: hypothetical protein IJI45_17515 [Anaerolineaceae bacterium]|nr:hypothetical protein [Anaerolineaceae bacterium]